MFSGGEYQCRKGLLYGPFSQVYGIGGILLTLLYHRLKAKSKPATFLICTLAGGLYEVGCSFLQELLFGTVSWDYEWMWGHFFGGRTNLIYMMLFGILGVVYIGYIYPWASGLIARCNSKRWVPFTKACAVLMVLNVSLSVMAVGRWTERLDGIPPATPIDQYIDITYPDATMIEIFPSMRPVEENGKPHKE